MRKTIHSLLIILLGATFLFALPQSAFADGGAGGLEKEVHGYHVKLVFAEEIMSGVNQFHVQITDPMGMPLANAEVEIEAMPAEEMDAHGSETETLSVGLMTSNSSMDMGADEPATGIMKPNTEETDGGHGESFDPVSVMLMPVKEGEYAGTVSFSKSGEWMFDVRFTTKGETNHVEFSFDVMRALATNYAILAGFIFVNATVITSAAALKRKTDRK